MGHIKKYLSLIKFSHTIFAMPFALIGFFLGVKNIAENGEQLFTQTNFVKFSLVILCIVSARSAAMAFNRYLDHHIDAKNPRTAIREIPSGVIKPLNALLFTMISSALFIISCYFINTLCFYLSFVSLFVVLFYSYTKRLTALCHLVLGVGLSLAPIGAFLAVTGIFNLLPILFSFLVLCWVSGFDIIYALQDEEFDQSHQLHSIPAAVGKKNALLISSILHVIAAIILICIGIFGHFAWLYWIGAFIFTGMLFYQHTIVKPNDLSKVNIAFMTANGIASIVFAFFVIADIIIK
jgi:4-hydroxybenzoate polyprenyltransferase